MIDWNDTKAASVKITFFDSEGSQIGFKRIDRPTQTKTVADAVEYYGKTFVVGNWTHIRCGKDGKMFFASGETDSDNWQDSYLVCTRAEYEAYVKEQEGEKWTHEIRATKEYCYISEGPNDSGQVFIKTNKGTWDCLYVEQLKPINPTISSKQVATIIEAAAAWGIAPDECQDYLSKFTVEEDEGECHF